MVSCSVGQGHRRRTGQAQGIAPTHPSCRPDPLDRVRLTACRIQHRTDAGGGVPRRAVTVAHGEGPSLALALSPL
ncbi:MAG TPA: hypothetical protein VFB60_17920 [Ktedonobacteraceae bacterium]|nr:hypothetical protein [Ktedonobacteraceae bacterium]